MNKLKAAIVILQTQGELPDNYLNHQLSENWIDHQECHLEPDWLLIYQMIDNELIFDTRINIEKSTRTVPVISDLLNFSLKILWVMRMENNSSTWPTVLT